MSEMSEDTREFNITSIGITSAEGVTVGELVYSKLIVTSVDEPPERIFEGGKKLMDIVLEVDEDALYGMVEGVSHPIPIIHLAPNEEFASEKYAIFLIDDENDIIYSSATKRIEKGLIYLDIFLIIKQYSLRRSGEIYVVEYTEKNEKKTFRFANDDDFGDFLTILTPEETES